MRRGAAIWLIARKDLMIERRSRVAAFQVLPFAGVVLIMFAFALDAKAVRFEDTPNGSTRSISLLPLVAPGLIWLTVLFALMLIVQRSFGIEREDGAVDTLRLAGIDASSIFWGKSMALAVQLAALEVVVIGVALVLYEVAVPGRGIALMLAAVTLATAALAIVGTLYGGLTVGGSGRESLLPLLVFPAVAPVIIGATRALESAFGTDGVAVGEGWPWVGLLAVYTIALAVGGSLAFGPLSEEAL